MSYSIVFKTKIIKLSDGRLLHLSLQGCNNDNAGRSCDDWRGKIYTQEEFLAYASKFMENSQPVKYTDGFDLKIGSRYHTWYDYGMHLLRMLKRATTFDEFKRSDKYSTFSKIANVIVFEQDTQLEMSMKEFDEYFYNNIYSRGIRYRINYVPLTSEADIIQAFDDGFSMRIYIN